MKKLLPCIKHYKITDDLQLLFMAYFDCKSNKNAMTKLIFHYFSTWITNLKNRCVCSKFLDSKNIVK